MQNHYYIYILASKRNGTHYIGVTNDLKRRVGVHKSAVIDGFTKKYNLNRLVWKIRLIQEINPEWNDLYEDLF
jgi:putative endonuclease